MKTLSLFCFLTLLLGGNWAQAQPLITDSVALRVLVFEHLQKNETKLLSEGAGITYRLKTDDKKRKGKIELIKEKSIVVSGQEYALSDFKMIAGKVRTDRQLLGGVLTGVGMTTTLIGGAFLNSQMGLGILVGGAAALGGGISLITGKKKFHFSKGWTVQAGTIRYAR